MPEPANSPAASRARCRAVRQATSRRGARRSRQRSRERCTWPGPRRLAKNCGPYWMPTPYEHHEAEGSDQAGRAAFGAMAPMIRPVNSTAPAPNELPAIEICPIAYPWRWRETAPARARLQAMCERYRSWIRSSRATAGITELSDHPRNQLGEGVGVSESSYSRPMAFHLKAPI